MDKLHILSSLHSDLLSLEAGAVVLGVADEQNVAVLGLARCEAALPDLQDVADALPEPLCILGAFSASREVALQTAVGIRTSGVCANDCLALYTNDGKLESVRVQGDGSVSGSLQLQTVASPEEWLKGYRIFRCELPVQLEVVEDGTVPFSGALQIAVQRLVRQLEAPELSYLVDAGSSGRLLLRSNSSAPVDSLPGGSTPATSGAASSTTSGVVQCSPLLTTTHLAAPAQGPAFCYLPLADPNGSSGGSSSGCITTTVCRATVLRLDALCSVPRSCPLGAAVKGLTRALMRQVAAAGRVLAKQGRVLPVRAYHFLPPGLNHPLTLLYPVLHPDPERNDLQLRPLRQALHALFGLPPNRPLLRPVNAVDLGGGAGGAEGGAAGEEDGGGSGAVARLRDVHVGLTAPNIGGSSVLVQGSYEYCHYMQDRFHDSGWGCAYRSLQTICSWFRAQKYTSKPIPSHKTIQQVLVRLGDKPHSFVGSSSWIGAIELSYILDEYLGVTCRILTVNRGADIPAHARELAAHFATVGSPVMIGGGVLAYTLLGVRFNEQTGEAAFLILDPHYTGGEDLKRIQQGTWVGWKRPGDNAAAGAPLFVEDAFYNFLLPQRPNTV